MIVSPYPRVWVMDLVRASLGLNADGASYERLGGAFGAECGNGRGLDATSFAPSRATASRPVLLWRTVPPPYQLITVGIGIEGRRNAGIREHVATKYPVPTPSRSRRPPRP